MSKMVDRSGIGLAAALLLFIAVPLSAQFWDLQGNYCSTRPGRCCPGRIDDCSVPILGTLCYCDDFCNRTSNADCCPDFWSFCKGIRPPENLKSCTYNGRNYGYLQTAKINCNECKCQPSPRNPEQLEFLCERETCMVEPQMISGINGARRGWTATNYTDFWGHRLSEGILYRLGTLQPDRIETLKMFPVQPHNDPRRLPRSFDARSRWPGWIHSVTDQGWCGSSWAISTTSVASDRLAIMTEGKEVVELSPQHLLSCHRKGQQGCNGGHLDRAWIYMRKFGVVSEDCYPYTSGSTSTSGKCSIPDHATLFNLQCINQQNSYQQRRDRYKTTPAYRLGREEDIMFEIMESGPVQATMKVYHDFFMYRGGVYSRTGMADEERAGYHSVRIIGWGEDTTQGRPIKYWLVANSWGPEWGENGLFRIVRGNNECDIENFVIAVWTQPPTSVPRRIGRGRGFRSPTRVQRN